MSRKVWVKLPGESDEAAMGFLIAELSTIADVLDACKGLFRTPKRCAPLSSSNVTVTPEPILGLRTKSGLVLQRTVFATQYCGTTLELIEMPVVRSKARTTALGSATNVAGAVPPEVPYVALPHRRADDAEAVQADGRTLRNHRRTQYVSATTAFKLTQERLLPPTSFTLRFKSDQRQLHLTHKHRKEWEAYQQDVDAAQQARRRTASPPSAIPDAKQRSSSAKRAGSPSQRSPLREPSPLAVHQSTAPKAGAPGNGTAQDATHDVASGNKFCRTDARGDVLRTSTPVVSSNTQAMPGSQIAIEEDPTSSSSYRRGRRAGAVAKPEPQRYLANRRPYDGGPPSTSPPYPAASLASSKDSGPPSVLEELWQSVRAREHASHDDVNRNDKLHSTAQASHPRVVQLLADVLSHVAALNAPRDAADDVAVSPDNNVVVILDDEVAARHVLEAEEREVIRALTQSATEQHAAACEAWRRRLHEEAAERLAAHRRIQQQHLHDEQVARETLEATQTAEVLRLLTAARDQHRFVLHKASVITEESTQRSVVSTVAMDAFSVLFAAARKEMEAAALRATVLQREMDARAAFEREESSHAKALQDAKEASAIAARSAVVERQARERQKRVAVVASAMADSEVISRRRVAVEENISRTELVEAAASDCRAAQQAAVLRIAAFAEAQRLSLCRTEPAARASVEADATKEFEALSQSAAADRADRFAWRQQLIHEYSAAVDSILRLEDELRNYLTSNESKVFLTAVDDFYFVANRVAGNSDRDLAPTRGRARSVIEEMVQEAAELHQQAVRQLCTVCSVSQEKNGEEGTEAQQQQHLYPDQAECPKGYPTTGSVLASDAVENCAVVHLAECVHLHLCEKESGARGDIIVDADHSHDAIMMSELQEYRSVVQLLSDRAQQRALQEEERNQHQLVLEPAETTGRDAVAVQLAVSMCSANEASARRQIEADWHEPFPAWAEQLLRHHQIQPKRGTESTPTNRTSEAVAGGSSGNDTRARPSPSSVTSDGLVRSASLSDVPVAAHQPVVRSATQHYISTSIEQRLQEALERKAIDEAHEQRRRRAQTTVGPRPKPASDSYFAEF